MTDSKRVVEAGDNTESLDHQCVDKMAELMKNELNENMRLKEGRKNWINDQARMHVLQTYYHTGKLQVAVTALELLMKDEDSSRHEIAFQQEQVKEFAADVANHAMMVLDTLDLLGVPKPEPKKEKPKIVVKEKKEDKKDEYGNWT